MSANDEVKLTCDFCTRQFSRREHLTRHVSSHVNQRLHQCGSCGKAFNRCDLLTRHRRISCSILTKNKAKVPKTRIRGACDSCAKAKARCSPSLPCIRCIKKEISCTRKAAQRSTNALQSDDGSLANQPVLDGSGPVESQLEVSRHDGNSSMAQCVSTLPMPLLSVNTDSTYASMFDWSFQSCTPSQGLSMDFLDLWALPGNGPQLDLGEMPEPYDAAAGRPDADTFATEPFQQVQQSASNELHDPSDSWRIYGGSGMVQPNLWEESRPRGSIEPGHDVNKAAYGREEPCGTPRSIINLLSLNDILAMEDLGHVSPVRQGQMAELSALIAKARCPESATCDPSVKGLLNNPKVINAFVQLYFEYYQPTLPLLHKATFNVSHTPPLLTLAVASIGSRFSKIPQASTLCSVLGGILRKAIKNLMEEEIHQTIEIPFAQAALLNQIQMAFDGSRHIALKAQFQRAMLITVCRGLNSGMRREDLLQKQENESDASCRGSAVSNWLDRELGRRLTYAIWLVDCQFSLHASVAPMMSLEDLDPCLPCPDTLWDLNAAALSRELHSSQMRLKDALNPRKLGNILRSQALGLFSQSIAMTAVFYQWYMATSVNRYILQGDVDQSRQHRRLHSPSWDHYGVAATGNELTPPKPLVPAVHRAQWTSAAFEAINAICSNITAYRKSDASQLLKLHHHISIMLIVPLQPMCEYIGWMATKPCMTAARESLCAWLRADIQNARRAVMHAIALFCLVRKRKSAAHSENHHLFVAFLTIWTFFSLDPLARPTNEDASASEDEEPSCCIEWDGGVDLAEKEGWIRASGHPRIRIAGVGSLEEPRGIHRILIETHRILLSDQVWGISRLFAGVLEGLISQGPASSQT
ncbi:fungal-specific transcription factor domain-containing protein [Aspergillus similis]